jgi:hypothetical protein
VVLPIAPHSTVDGCAAQQTSESGSTRVTSPQQWPYGGYSRVTLARPVAPHRIRRATFGAAQQTPLRADSPTGRHWSPASPVTPAPPHHTTVTPRPSPSTLSLPPIGHRDKLRPLNDNIVTTIVDVVVVVVAKRISPRIRTTKIRLQMPPNNFDTTNK